MVKLVDDNTGNGGVLDSPVRDFLHNLETQFGEVRPAVKVWIQSELQGMLETLDAEHCLELDKKYSEGYEEGSEEGYELGYREGYDQARLEISLEED